MYTPKCTYKSIVHIEIAVVIHLLHTCTSREECQARGKSCPVLPTAKSVFIEALLCYIITINQLKYSLCVDISMHQ